jgi:hypothetical protein
MATITPPYADLGRASFEVMDSYLQNYLLAGQHPELQQAFSFPMAINTSFAQFSVVGLDAAGKLALATYGAAAAAATGTLTFSGVGTAADTITIGTRTYTLVAALTAANQVLIGASVTASAANLVAAINGAAGAGTTYGADTVSHPSVTASSAVGVVTITAKELGPNGNDVVTTEAGTGTSFGAATLAGGRNLGGVKPIGVLAQSATLGATGTLGAPVWYSGCFNRDALIWHGSYDTNAKKEAAFRDAPTPTNIIVAVRGA